MFGPFPNIVKERVNNFISVSKLTREGISSPTVTFESRKICDPIDFIHEENFQRFFLTYVTEPITCVELINTKARFRNWYERMKDGSFTKKYILT